MPGTIAKKQQRITDDDEHDIIRRGLFEYYNAMPEGPHVHYPLNQTTEGTHSLGVYADFYDFALLEGRRMNPSTQTKIHGSSYIQVIKDREIFAGIVDHIFVHHQQGFAESGKTPLVLVRWMELSERTPLNRDQWPWAEEEL